MKKILVLFFLLGFLVNTKLNAQDVFNLEVFPGLTQLNIPSLIVNENLNNIPRLFRVTMNLNPNRRVVLKGRILWSKKIGAIPKLLYQFATRPFLGQSFTNRDLNKSKIRIASDHEGEKGVFDEILKLGKPTGTIRIELILFEENGITRIAADQKTLNFLNPTRTLQIRNPLQGSFEDVGNVLLDWNKVVGAQQYLIKANVRKNKSVSLEEALNSGRPLIDKKVRGEINRINMRQLLQREWLPGQEIVVQVAAVVKTVNGQELLKSDLVSFYISGTNNSLEKKNDPQVLIDNILSGKLTPDNIKSVMVNGKRINPAELLRILTMLKTNPDLIISKRFIRN